MPLIKCTKNVWTFFSNFLIAQCINKVKLFLILNHHLFSKQLFENFFNFRQKSVNFKVVKNVL